MLSEKENFLIKEEVDYCKKPLIFFDDDSDGVCSFLQLYKYKKEGKGIIVKSIPYLDDKFLKKVEEYNPDKIFVLDIASLSNEFVNNIKQRIVWVDHHSPQNFKRIMYFNPRTKNDSAYYPVSAMMYDVFKQDLWLAVVGCIGDAYFADFFKEFSEKYPKLLPKNVKNIETIRRKTKIGALAMLFNFLFKGTTQEAMKNVKILSRIEDPLEIINQTTSRGRFIMKYGSGIKKYYDEMIEEINTLKPKGNLLVFPYKDRKYSFTTEIANELMFRFPKKIVIVAREKNGEMKMSLRSTEYDLVKTLNKVFQEVEGKGGGHPKACGSNVKVENFELFLKKVEEYAKKFPL